MSVDFSYLNGFSELWQEWRFEPWQNGSASGLFRRVSLIKAGLIGEVARYYVDDYIVWRYLPDDFVRLRKEAKSEPDLMTQRFVFLQDKGRYSLKKSSLWLGFRGFVEVHKYTLGSEPVSDIRDIAYLVNLAHKRVMSISN